MDPLCWQVQGLVLVYDSLPSLAALTVWEPLLESTPPNVLLLVGNQRGSGVLCTCTQSKTHTHFIPTTCFY